ncbi:hypothetical protein AOLI_G00128890 [Acnodon oligacanthus]
MSPVETGHRRSGETVRSRLASICIVFRLLRREQEAAVSEGDFLARVRGRSRRPNVRGQEGPNKDVFLGAAEESELHARGNRRLSRVATQPPCSVRRVRAAHAGRIRALLIQSRSGGEEEAGENGAAASGGKKRSGMMRLPQASRFETLPRRQKNR